LSEARDKQKRLFFCLSERTKKHIPVWGLFIMLQNIKKIQELNIFWRKVILFTIVFVLAVPLLALIVKRFSSRMLNVSTENIVKSLEITEKLDEAFSQVEEANQDFQEQLKNLASTTVDISTTTTSTEDF